LFKKGFWYGFDLKKRKLEGAIYRLEYDNYLCSKKGKRWDEANKEWVIVPLNQKKVLKND